MQVNKGPCDILNDQDNHGTETTIRTPQRGTERSELKPKSSKRDPLKETGSKEPPTWIQIHAYLEQREDPLAIQIHALHRVQDRVQRVWQVLGDHEQVWRHHACPEELEHVRVPERLKRHDLLPVAEERRGKRLLSQGRQ